ncbi:MAG: hypothetical protein Q7J80_15385 [Anaerolineales bacterium]|nr:hypothetical protein [Anaerolineales bacterium]
MKSIVFTVVLTAFVLSACSAPATSTSEPIPTLELSPTQNSDVMSPTLEPLPTQNNDVVWQWDGEKWRPSGSPPNCIDPITLESPIDITTATAILYPGQTRGGDYKAHGGFRFDNAPSNSLDVKIPLDGHIIEASRYIEQGEVQYFFIFTSPCGIAYRLDHLLSLTSKFQAVADTLPEAKVDDSRTTLLKEPVAVKPGEIIATAIGFASNGNVSFDFGVYDVRKLNEASQDPAWAAKHEQSKEFDYYGICWLDLLPSKDVEVVKLLPGGDQQAGKTSDYCK